MKKILITGGAGFIGLHLAKLLHVHGYAVDLVDNFSRAVQDRDLETFAQLPNVRLLNQNLLNEDAWDSLENDYFFVFHLAAIIGVKNVMERPYEVLEKNVRLMELALSFAQRCKQLDRFVFTSTSEVYAGTLQYFELPIPTPESTPLAITELSHPRTSYMLSKIYGEALCHQSDIPWTIIRPHNFYGPRMGMAHVIPEQLKKAYFSSDGAEQLVLSPKHRRTFCFIEDAVKVMMLAAENHGCNRETLNVGMEHPELTIMDLCRIVINVTGRDVSLVPGEETPGSPARRCPSMAKVASLLGYVPSTSVEEGVRKTFEWYQATVFEFEGACAV